VEWRQWELDYALLLITVLEGHTWIMPHTILIVPHTDYAQNFGLHSSGQVILYIVASKKPHTFKGYIHNWYSQLLEATSLIFLWYHTSTKTTLHFKIGYWHRQQSQWMYSLPFDVQTIQLTYYNFCRSTIIIYLPWNKLVKLLTGFSCHHIYWHRECCCHSIVLYAFSCVSQLKFMLWTCT